ncbi:thioredoxin family protein [Ancylomarina longa]|uniref:DUF255 domain-containing protein n=1 Tax=Ancylomarina longa TaxID=2487017 RepID=A0A434AXW9_9BACT|nr:thioredoxin family protein [Ancylomarina longa]RUT79403.1 DUF255 domain-containing protein [Ancylomarina longa]
MKKLAILAAGIILLIFVAAKYADKESDTAGNSGITFFTGSWEQAVELAKQENKPIFLDISTSWCGYCRRMKANVFTDADVAAFYNASFINVSLDAEHGEGSVLAGKYRVSAYPSFLFFNSDGSFSSQTAGYRNSDNFLELGKRNKK